MVRTVTVTFYHWLAVSLLLHAGIVIPFVLGIPHGPRHKGHYKLTVELYGMIADRQQEEKKGGTPKKQAAVRPREAKKTTPKQTVEKEKTPITESPVVHEEKTDTGKDDSSEITGSEVRVASSPGASGMGGEGISQRQLSIGHAQESDRTKAYLARLAKKLHSHLVYPEETRRSGVEGVAWIAFVITESGTIKDNFVKIVKSSGYAALDSNAIQSALASVPFEKPPTEAKQKIEDIRKKAVNGEDFASLARTYSEDVTAQNGGDLGYIRSGQIMKPLEDALFALKPNEVSKVVETKTGYHLFKAIDRKPETTQSFEEVKDRLRALLKQKKGRQEANALVGRLRRTATVEIYLPAEE